MKTILPVRQRGFTLVEIAIGFMVIAIGMSLGVSLLSSLIDTQKIRVSNARLDTVTQALIDFVGKNSRLPCPAVPTLNSASPYYGVENPNPSCAAVPTVLAAITVPSASPTTAVGVVPWTTLGISQDMVIDGYGGMLTYMVTITETSRNKDTVAYMKGSIESFSGTPVTEGLPKTTTTQNQLNACNQTPGDDSCRLAAVVALISHGKNGNGSFTSSGGLVSDPDTVAAPEEYENANLSNTSLMDAKVVVQNQGLRSSFDDLVRVLSPTDILGPLSKAGSVLSPTALTRQRLQVIKSALLSYMAQSVGNVLLDAASVAATGTSTATYGRVTSKDGSTYGLANPVNLGYVPWSTLGLPSVIAYDGWGNPFYYQMESTLVTTGLHAQTPLGKYLGFRIQSVGVDGTRNNTDDVYIDTSVSEIRGLFTSIGIQYTYP